MPKSLSFKSLNIIVGFLNLNCNHWAAICAIKDFKKFFYIDPFVADESEINLAFQNWNKFMASRPTGEFPRQKDWEIGIFNHDKQTESFNCGVLCIKFLETIIVDNLSVLRFKDDSIKDYRSEYLKLLKDYPLIVQIKRFDTCIFFSFTILYLFKFFLNIKPCFLFFLFKILIAY